MGASSTGPMAPADIYKKRVSAYDEVVVTVRIKQYIAELHE